VHQPKLYWEAVGAGVLPEGYARPALQYTGAACSLEQKGSLLILCVKGEEQKADVQIYFQEEQEA
jgi:hypothetical protein